MGTGSVVLDALLRVLGLASPPTDQRDGFPWAPPEGFYRARPAPTADDQPYFLGYSDRGGVHPSPYLRGHNSPVYGDPNVVEAGLARLLAARQGGFTEAPSQPAVPVRPAMPPSPVAQPVYVPPPDPHAIQHEGLGWSLH